MRQGLSFGRRLACKATPWPSTDGDRDGNIRFGTLGHQPFWREGLSGRLGVGLAACELLVCALSGIGLCSGSPNRPRPWRCGWCGAKPSCRWCNGTSVRAHGRSRPPASSHRPATGRRFATDRAEALPNPVASSIVGLQIGSLPKLVESVSDAPAHGLTRCPDGLQSIEQG